MGWQPEAVVAFRHRFINCNPYRMQQTHPYKHHDHDWGMKSSAHKKHRADHSVGESAGLRREYLDKELVASGVLALEHSPVGVATEPVKGKSNTLWMSGNGKSLP